MSISAGAVCQLSRLVKRVSAGERVQTVSFCVDCQFLTEQRAVTSLADGWKLVIPVWRFLALYRDKPNRLSERFKAL
ncbi:hypothetical protein [Pelagibaculum spongiae]|uniref:Uncharacterized protein n=1 Tax=Pelagibaculum spongiae TaxID=2080658 RepID=A0A2V1H5D3_9GAMM|nr:hypothetical protein [Pelagibaculum spongiae]PVZ71975.1 hypothetical protein DC094_02835 [Pelagibaculum spongiae]